MDRHEGAERCAAERKKFEESCSAKWIEYFDRRKDYLVFKGKAERGELDDIKS